MADQRFVQRVLHQQLGQLTDQIGVLAKLQLIPDPVQDGGNLVNCVAKNGGIAPIG